MDECITIDDFENICNKEIEDYVQLNQIAFVDKINSVISSFSVTNDTFLNRLLKMSKSSIFSEILCCLKFSSLCEDLQLKILRMYDFFIQGCSNKEELQIMFNDNFTAKMIEYKFNMSNSDIQRSFLSVLKGISMKFSFIEKEWIYDEKKCCCPMFSICIKNINLDDSIAMAASRMVILNLCLFGNKDILEQCYDLPNSKKYFKKLLDAFDDECFEFITDLMNVAPKRLNDIIISVFEKKLNILDDNKCKKQFNIDFLIKTLCFLSDGPMRPLIRKTLKKNVLDMPMNEVPTLGILLYSFEHNLLLLDDLINMGIVGTDNLKIERLSVESPEKIIAQKNNRTMEKIKKYFMNSLANLNSFDLMSHVLIIHIFEKICPKIPQIIIDYLNKLLELMLNYNGEDIKIIYFVDSMFPQRYELDYVTSTNCAARCHVSNFNKFTIVLAEIVSAISNWKKSLDHKFIFEHIESEFTSFGVEQNHQRVQMSKSKLLIGEKMYPLWNVNIAQVSKKYVELEVINNNEQARRTFTLINRKGKEIIVFSQQANANKFIQELIKNQKILINNLLRKIQVNYVYE